MMKNNDKGRFLSKLADTVAVTDPMYKKVEQRYEGITTYFKEKALKDYDLELYVQGSFALGTAIKPINPEGEYDVDIICKLKDGGADILHMPPTVLKQKVGYAVLSYCNSIGILKAPENNRKCWTIHYSGSEHFHIDIVPALIGDDLYLRQLKAKGFDPKDIPDLEKAIVLTETGKVDWDVSNPLAYINWFDNINSRDTDLMEKTASFHKVEVAQLRPNYKRTDLQRAIQLIKRHRDYRCGEDKDKPVSVILTTIAAMNYDYKMTLIEFLEFIPIKLLESLDQGFVKNPVNPLEDFADKWKHVPRKKEKFRDWAEQLKKDVNRIVSASSIDEVEGILSPSMGSSIIKEAALLFQSNDTSSRLPKPIGAWGTH